MLLEIKIGRNKAVLHFSDLMPFPSSLRLSTKIESELRSFTQNKSNLSSLSSTSTDAHAKVAFMGSHGFHATALSLSRLVVAAHRRPAPLYCHCHISARRASPRGRGAHAGSASMVWGPRTSRRWASCTELESSKSNLQPDVSHA